MAKVLITEGHLADIADAIRAKLESEDTYTPGEMARAIMEIETGYPEPTGSMSITENGTYNVKDVASAVVAVPTSEPVLQSKTAVRNGTVTPDVGYDGLSRVVVNVPSTGPIAPIIRCGMAKGSMTQTLDLSSVNAEKLIVVAMNGDTDNKTLGTHVETLSSALTGTTLDYHQYSATGDNRMNYRIDAYDLSAGVSDLEISLTDGWVDEHTAFAWALIGAGDFVIGKVMTTLEAATTGSNDRSGSVLFGTMNGSGAGSSGGTVYSDIYHKGDTVATDDPGSGYMGSYIIWFAESGGGGENWPMIDSVVETGSGFTATLAGSVPLDTSGFPTNVKKFYDNYARSTKPTKTDYSIELSQADTGLTLAQLLANHPVPLVLEYYNYVYGRTAMIEDLGLVLLGDFSQGGAATGNALSDSIDNYSAILLQGIYRTQRTSEYNTSMLYVDVELNKRYWAGMKDRNSTYDCNVTFTDDQTVSLTGNKQVIIYGMP